MKKSIVVLLISTILSFPAYASGSNVPKTFILPDSNASITNKSSRDLGRNYTNVYNDRVLYSHQMSEKNIIIKRKNSYLIIRGISYLKDSWLKMKNFVFYIFQDKDSNNLGYNFLSPKLIYKQDSTLDAIKQLDLNQNYLKDSVQTNNINFYCYQKEHDGYMERYITAKTNKYDYILSESFYPLEFENYFKPKLKDYLKIVTKRINDFEKSIMDDNDIETNMDDMEDKEIEK